MFLFYFQHSSSISPTPLDILQQALDHSHVAAKGRHACSRYKLMLKGILFSDIERNTSSVIEKAMALEVLDSHVILVAEVFAS